MRRRARPAYWLCALHSGESRSSVYRFALWPIDRHASLCIRVLAEPPSGERAGRNDRVAVVGRLLHCSGDEHAPDPATVKGFGDSGVNDRQAVAFEPIYKLSSLSRRHRLQPAFRRVVDDRHRRSRQRLPPIVGAVAPERRPRRLALVEERPPSVGPAPEGGRDLIVRRP